MIGIELFKGCGSSLDKKYFLFRLCLLDPAIIKRHKNIRMTYLIMAFSGINRYPLLR